MKGWKQCGLWIARTFPQEPRCAQVIEQTKIILDLLLFSFFFPVRGRGPAVGVRAVSRSALLQRQLSERQLASAQTHVQKCE